MSEQAWLTILSAGVAISLGLLSLLLVLLVDWRNALIDEVKNIRVDLKASVSEINRISATEHKDIWDRIYHHNHGEHGEVVIPK